MSVLVGGVAELYQGDLDVGRHAVARLAGEDLGPGVVVEDLHYGAVAVAQRLEDLRPGALILVGAMRRGRAPGTVERRRVRGVDRSPDELQRAVTHAVTGYVDIDLVLDVASALGALPERTVTVELEPVATDVADRLSPEAERRVGDVVALAAEEARRVALLTLAGDLRALERPDVPALAPLDALLAELEVLDEEGSWGETFALRDRLRDRMAGEVSGDALGAENWALAWALVEELDRLERGVAPPAGG